MSSLHQMGRALRIGFGVSLVAGFALMSGCASVDVDDESQQSVEPSPGEANESLRAVFLPANSYSCMTAGGLILATLAVQPGGKCFIIQPESFGSDRRFCVGAFPFLSCQDCNAIAIGNPGNPGCALVP
jgi:hypothetical protein